MCTSASVSGIGPCRQNVTFGSVSALFAHFSLICFLCVICASPRVEAAGFSDETKSAFLAFLDKADETKWCRWTAITPTLTSEPLGLNQPFSSGISAVEVIWHDGVQYIVVHDFMNLGNLWIDTYGQIWGSTTYPAEIDKLNLEVRTADKTPSGHIRGLKSGFQTSFGVQSYNNRSYFASGTILYTADVDKDGVLTIDYSNRQGNSYNGFITCKGQASDKLPVSSTELKKLELSYVSAFKLEFFCGDANVVRRSGDGSERTYAATIKDVSFDSKSGLITVDGLYGMPFESRTKCFDLYTNGRHEFDDSPVVIELAEGGEATIDRHGDVDGPVLNVFVRPLKADITGSGNNYSLNFNKTRSNRIYIANMLVAEGDMTDKLKENATHLDMTEVTELYHKIESKDFGPIRGSWSMVENIDNDSPNRHWLRDDNWSGALTVNFGPHYILPIEHYDDPYYSQHKNTSPYAVSAIINPSDPERIDELTFSVPATSGMLSSGFELGDYGRHDIGADRGVNLYITGRLNDIAHTDLYILRGEITDYENDALADTEHGHARGICVSDGKYDLTHGVSAAADIPVEASSTAANNISILVPDADIPGSTADANQVYTLYTRAKDDNGNYRFRVVKRLDQTTTGAIESTCMHDIEAYTLNGGIIEALTPLTIFDTMGRTLARLSAGQTQTLAAGLYIIRPDSRPGALPATRITIR